MVAAKLDMMALFPSKMRKGTAYVSTDLPGETPHFLQKTFSWASLTYLGLEINFIFIIFKWECQNKEQNSVHWVIPIIIHHPLWAKAGYSKQDTKSKWIPSGHIMLFATVGVLIKLLKSPHIWAFWLANFLCHNFTCSQKVRIISRAWMHSDSICNSGLMCFDG